jgi:glycyl-tRNA synthetase
MMGTRIGRKTGYIRPETAQGSYLSFKRLVKFHREKLPFGVIQVGKAYRNEISPRQGVLRLREFSMAELELFVHPKEKKRHPRFSEVKNLRLRLLWDGNEEKMSVGDAVKRKIFSSEYLAYHLAKSYLFLLSLGFPEEKIRFRKHGERERAHYALECWDGEIKTSRFGWVEVVGIADRGEYDLRAHSSSSGEQLGVWVPFKKPRVERRIKVKPRYEKIRERFGKDAGSIIKELEKIKVRRRTKKIKLSRWTLSQEFYQMEEKEEEIKGEFVIPHVVEPSYGIDRLIYTILENSYHEEVVGQEKRSVLKLPPSLAPVEVAVLPLLSRDELVKKAREIERRLRGEFLVDYDESGSIGRRYRRQDEIGTPFCITIDHATLEDNTVTIRERDTMRQERCGSGNLRMRLRELLAE